jgi:predicted ester cyclase
MEQAMSVDTNKALARRFIEHVFVAGHADAVDDLVTPSFVSHGLPGTGPEVMKAAIARVAPPLTDSSMVIEDSVGEGDRIAIRLTSSAVQSGLFMGMAPTGKRYTIEELHLFRIEDGRIAEHWHQGDMLGMMRELGVLPDPSKKG